MLNDSFFDGSFYRDGSVWSDYPWLDERYRYYFSSLLDDTMTLCWNDMKLTFVKNDDIAKAVNWLTDHSKFVAEEYLINEKFDYAQTRETFLGVTYYVLTNADGDICFAQPDGEADIFDGYI